MRKQRTPNHRPTDDEPRVPDVLGIDPELVKQIALDVFNAGFVTRDQLTDRYGATTVTAVVALLYRTHRIFREVSRPSDHGEVRGFEWADRRFSAAQIAKLPPALGFISELHKSTANKYDEYQTVTVRCRFTNKCLGPVPMSTSDEHKITLENGDPYLGDYNGFERDGNGDVLIPRNCVRAMTEKMLPFIGKPTAVAFHIGYEPVVIHGVKTFIHRRGSVDKRTGQGQGIRYNEALPAGTEFSITATIPTTAITVAEWGRGLQRKDTTLSPASSSAFGDFDVIG